MWIISQTGFVSLVQDRTDHSKVWVRARIKEDIAMMFPAHAEQIMTKIGADYIYRLIIPKEVAALAMWNAVQDVDYDSHAKEVMNRRSHPNSKRMGAYYKIWNALADLQPFAPYAHHPRPVAGMAAHTHKSSQPTLPATGKGYPWHRNPSFSGSGYDDHTGFRNGQPLTAEDYHASDNDADWPNEAVDLINDGEPDEATIETEINRIEGLTKEEQDALTDDEWDAIETMSEDEWSSYIAKREAERSGPKGKTRKRNPRRSSRRAPQTNVTPKETVES